MALKALYTDGWFALGAAVLKARDIDKAFYIFTCSVKLDPDNGEAWNNIACLHMMKKRSKEAFIAFKEALKYRRNSWQLWENYSQVAADIRNFGQIVRSGKGDNIWGLYGRWHRMKGDLTMCSEALLKQVRSYQG